MAASTDFYFQWHITNACNNRRKHCYHSDYKPQNEASGEQLLQIADCMDDTLKKWGFIGSLSITGGEPFIRREELYKLLAYIEGLSNIAEYDILTNGTLITNHDLERLSAFSKLRRVQVSLEGSNASLHDAIRGVGDFDRVTDAIRRLRAGGFVVSVMTTLTKNNKEDIPSMLELLRRLDVNTFALERFMPEGQGAHNAEWMLSKEEIKEVFSFMTEQAFKIQKPRLLLYRTLYCLCSDDSTIGAMCSAGVSALTIMPDGTMLPCRRLPIPIGNVFTNGIIDTWYHSELLWNLRDYSAYEGKCGSCPHFTECRGCRSMAYLATGNYMMEDPQCWL